MTAIAGGEITVPTIYGDVIMKVNPGVQSEEMKKLAHKGIQDSSRGPGNHYVKLKVETPKYYHISYFLP
jgi:molecular chaperone DnaJ